MNYYERIQKSIDYIENNLDSKISLKDAAQEAFMSLSNYYRMFFALVGYPVKEYIRKRRISLAAKELKESYVCLIDLAVKYDFESGDAFSRAFKRVTGYLPSTYRKENVNYSFERVEIMDKYFDIQDKELLNKYPNIKVLKEVEPMRVAYYNYVGKEPEAHAFDVIKKWLEKCKLNINNGKTRIFGYDTSHGKEEHGYEVCVTIDDDMVVDDEHVKTKILPGGLYAVTSVKRENGVDIGTSIINAWEHFRKWLNDSKYTYGTHQWLEEHLGFDTEANHIGGVDLYMPIVEKPIDSNDTHTFETVNPMWTATYTATGVNAIDEGRDYFFKWAEKEGLFNQSFNHRIFAYYNSENLGKKDFFYKIHITVDKDFSTDDPNIKFEMFNGGYYAKRRVKYVINGWSWMDFIDWVNNNSEYTFGDYWFIEEYLIQKPLIDNDTDVIQYMPIKKK